MQREKISYQLDQMEVVNWYIKVMEDGRDTKTIMKDYLKQKKIIEKLKTTIEK